MGGHHAAADDRRGQHGADAIVVIRVTRFIGDPPGCVPSRAAIWKHDNPPVTAATRGLSPILSQGPRSGGEHTPGIGSLL